MVEYVFALLEGYSRCSESLERVDITGLASEAEAEYARYVIAKQPEGLDGTYTSCTITCQVKDQP